MTKKKPMMGRPPLPRDALGLTPPQLLVLRELLRGASDVDITHALGITEYAVHAHVAEIFRILKVERNNRTGVILEIIRRGGIDLQAVLDKLLRNRSSRP